MFRHTRDSGPSHQPEYGAGSSGGYGSSMGAPAPWGSSSRYSGQAGGYSGQASSGGYGVGGGFGAPGGGGVIDAMSLLDSHAATAGPELYGMGGRVTNDVVERARALQARQLELSRESLQRQREEEVYLARGLADAEMDSRRVLATMPPRSRPGLGSREWESRQRTREPEVQPRPPLLGSYDRPRYSDMDDGRMRPYSGSRLPPPSRGPEKYPMSGGPPGGANGFSRNEAYRGISRSIENRPQPPAETRVGPPGEGVRPGAGPGVSRRRALPMEAGKLMYECTKCQFATTTPPPSFNQQCKACKVRVHRTEELCSHLIVHHGRHIKPIKLMKCDLCPPEAAFSVREPLAFCEHRLHAHGFCVMHFMCSRPNCSLLFSTPEDANTHVPGKNCKTLYAGSEPKTSTVAPAAKRARPDEVPSPTKANKEPVRQPATSRLGAKPAPSGEEGEADQDMNAVFNKLEAATGSGGGGGGSGKPVAVITAMKAKQQQEEQHSPAEDALEVVDEAEEDLLDKALQFATKEPQARRQLECGSCSKTITTDFLLRCKECPDSISLSSRKFIDLPELFAHLTTSHSIELPDVNVPCVFCPPHGQFSAPAVELQRHVNEVHKVCPHHFNCPHFCNRLFKEKTDVLNHFKNGECPKKGKKIVKSPGAAAAKAKSSPGGAGGKAVSPASSEGQADPGKNNPDSVMDGMLQYTQQLLD